MATSSSGVGLAAIDQINGPRRLGRYVLLTVTAAIVLFPIYVMVIGAFKPSNKVLDQPLLPSNFTLTTFKNAWHDGHLGRALINSAVVAVIVTIAQLVTAVLAAYAFVFLKFPGRNIVFGVFLGTLLVPLEATLTVNRRTMQSFGWLNSYQGLTVPFLATAFGIFMIRQVFLTIPKEMREAASMDGLGHIGFLREVAVPLSRPTIGALAVFAFLTSWNQYLWPVLITTNQDYNTVQTGIKVLKATSLDQPNLVIAGTVIVAIPIFIVLIAFQRQLVRGLTAGAVKG
jgi:sn-glycerol 3-phosphate transport system permease protein